MCLLYYNDMRYNYPTYANRVDWAYYHNLHDTCCDTDCESQPGF